MYKDMRTGPHHVFRIEGEKDRILLILIINTAFFFNFELDKVALATKRKSNILLIGSINQFWSWISGFLSFKVFMLGGMILKLDGIKNKIPN